VYNIKYDTRAVRTFYKLFKQDNNNWCDDFAWKEVDGNRHALS